MNCWRARVHLNPPCAEADVVLDLPVKLQANGWSCGEAAARIVFEFHGARGKKPRSSPIDGTDPRAMETSLWLSGLSVQAGSMDLDDLRHHTRKGRPVICLVTEASGEGHWVVCAGVTRGYVWYSCPADGACKERVASFEARWADVDRMGVRYVRWGLAAG